MKKFALALAALIAFGGSAFAADIPTRAAVLKAPAAVGMSWTGFYLNAGFGYGIWAADTTTLNPDGTCHLCTNQVQGGKGWVGVIGGGYDHQFTPKIVGGVFADFNLSSIKGTIQDQDPFFAGEIKQNRSWAVGGRLGWLIVPEAMPYLNAGYTAAHFSSTSMLATHTGAPTAFGTPAFTTHGWFIGGGVETSLASWMPGLFLRTEYRYARYGTTTLPDTSPVVAANSITFKPAVQTVTSQLVYKFHTPGGATAIASAPVPVTWSGVYANAGIGYGFWAADTTTLNPSGTCHLCVVQVQGGKGWLAVLGGGYDHQFTPKIVAGVFADFNVSSLKGTIQDQDPFFTGEIKQTSAWAVGGRIGWLLTQEILSYWNAGYTRARFSSTSMLATHTGAPTAFGTPAFNTNGWFMGGGFEASLASIAPGWFWRNEYRYARYGTTTLADTSPAGPANSITFKPTVQTATTQLVYKLNWSR